MLQRVRYKQEYFELASRIMHAEGKKKELKACDDVYAIAWILSGRDTIINPYSLDERLRGDYEWIEKLETLSGLGNRGRVAAFGQPVYLSETEILAERLKADLRGIYADVLISHGKIKCLDELFLVR